MNSIKLLRTNSTNSDFQKLVVLLDQDLHERDGDEHDFYTQFYKTDKLQHVIVAYEDEKAVGCGAVRIYEEGVGEIKRMFVLLESRGQGIAGKVLVELEKWAQELGYSTCILETGKRQPEAIRLYHKSGYELIPNFGDYQGVENSVCFRKSLNK